jgi:DNA-binding MarR family transcriptional regulator
MTLAQLARRLRLDKGWTSRAVDHLVAEGLVEKAAGATDRRTIALSLTEAGRAERRRLDGLLDAQVARVIGRVPHTERPAVARALRLLHDAYIAELGEQDTGAERLTCATTR